MFETTSPQYILIFIVSSVLLMLLLVTFIVSIIYKYQKKQHLYISEVGKLKATHENELLKSQIEMQEQTFENIAREIHDNIGQKLSLAKLHLNTLNYVNTGGTRQQINNSVDIISEALNDLSDLSRSMNAEIILNNGLIKALEFEVGQLTKSGVYHVELNVTGNPVYLNGETELLLFRIVQEIIHNIIKHAQASKISMHLYYAPASLQLVIMDNGRGFILATTHKEGAGLVNMKKRTKLLKGSFSLDSLPDEGTSIKIEIPINENIVYA